MYKNYPGLTFDQINIFLTAAKFENFSKAAKALNITQPAVSKNIAAMEDILGIVLFERQQKRVRLTNAGTLLAKNFEQILEQTSDFVDKAQQVQGNQFNKLKVCSPNILRNNQFLRPVIQKFQEQNPLVEISFEIIDPFKQIDLLIDGFYDVGIIASSYANYLRKNGLLTRSFTNDFPYLMISRQHPLYAHAEENISEVLSSPIAVVSDESQLYSKWVQEVLNELDLPHGALDYVSNMDSAVALVDMGSHIMIADRINHFNSSEEVKYIPLKSISKSGGLSIVYKNNPENIFIHKFVSILEKTGWPE